MLSCNMQQPATTLSGDVQRTGTGYLNLISAIRVNCYPVAMRMNVQYERLYSLYSIHAVIGMKKG